MFENRKALYISVIETINSYIKTNELKPGDQIPSEPELVRLLHVSRATVRMAMQELVNAGVLEKIQGKGTFVKPPSTSIDINQFLSFSTLAKTIGSKHHSVVSKLEKLDFPPKDVCTELDIHQGESVWYIQRLRYLDGEPALFEETYIPFKFFKNLDGYRLEKESIYDVFEDYGFHYLTGKERIIPIALNEEVAKFFEVQIGDPAIILIKTMKNYNQPVEYTKGIFKNGKYELTASIVKINI